MRNYEANSEMMFFFFGFFLGPVGLYFIMIHCRTPLVLCLCWLDQIMPNDSN